MSIAQPNKDRKHFHITDNTQGVLTLRFMPIPVNIEQLLGATSIESSRIEYKKGWNPDAIYRTICAFANDIDNTGGGYIIIGVEERNGRPIRPVKGLSLEEIEPIEREMIGFNNLIRPIYYPRTSPLKMSTERKCLSSGCPEGQATLTKCLMKSRPNKRNIISISATILLPS